MLKVSPQRSARVGASARALRVCISTRLAIGEERSTSSSCACEAMRCSLHAPLCRYILSWRPSNGSMAAHTA